MSIRSRIRAWLGLDSAPKPAPERPFTISESVLMAGGTRSANTIVRRELTMPALPPGVIPAEDKQRLAMDDAGAPGQNFFGWNNGLGLLGCGLYFPGYPYLAELAQRSEYMNPINIIAQEMTRKWIKLSNKDKTDNSDKLLKIDARMKELGVQEAFRRVEVQDGRFGRSQIYIDIDGHDSARELPLIISPETIPKGSLKALTVIEPMWTTPVVWNSLDPAAPDFYKPSIWYVLGKKTHASRLITFVSREVPDLLKPSYNFGGISLSQLMEPYVNQWLKTRDGVAKLITNFSKMVLSTDMSSAMAGGDGQEFWKRIALANKASDNGGMWVVNKDTEEVTNVSVPLGGLHELQAQSQEHMCMPTMLPLVVLTGITPSGLNASSEGEMQVHNNNIHARQESNYTKPMTMVLQLIQCDLFGAIDDNISFEFESLTDPDGEALARQRKTDGEAGAGYIAAGVISPEEERDRLIADPTSGYNGLTGPPPEPPEDPDGGPDDTDSDSGDE